MISTVLIGVEFEMKNKSNEGLKKKEENRMNGTVVGMIE